MNEKKLNFAIAQINYIVGDIKYNKNKVEEYIKKAIENKCSFIIFPKNFLLGSFLGDILKRFCFIEEQYQNAVLDLKKYSKDITILSFSHENQPVIIKDNEILNDETVEINEIKFVLKDSFDKKIDTNFDYLIHFATSYSKYLEEQKRQELIKEDIQKYNKKFIYLNLVGANDSYVFDGSSRIYDEVGNLKLLAKSFEEDFIVADIFNIESEIKKPIWFNDFKKEFDLDYEMDLDRTYKSIKLAIKDYYSKNGLKQAVLGLSGGLDSTVCAVLLADALGKENVYGISMPSKLTSTESKNDAQKLVENIGINFLEVPIKDIQDDLTKKFDYIFNEVNKNWKNQCVQSYTQDNIQARSRATILWGVANEFYSTIPIATSDKSESYMGYATINGDMSGGFAPILDVTKTKLFALARWINRNKEIIPKNIIQKPPGAELAINPKTGKTLTAEEALMPYEFMDEVIWRIENFHQSIDNMMKIKFVYEKKNIVTEEQKRQWLEKFFKRYNTALFKSYIMPIAPVVDSHSILKNEFNISVSSNINY